MLNYDTLPGFEDEVREYIEQGIEPPDHEFLYELLCNDLVGVYRFGDDINIATLKTWVEWVYWEIPGNAWGSPAKVTAWCEKGGMNG